MINKTVRVAAIHDLSGIGRCSLSVILPTLSTMGIQVCPVPTAVLTAHTGFGEFVLRDLTEYISSALFAYKKSNESFDCIYSGFLASTDQIDHCLDFFKEYKSSLKIVDPVLGDNGKPYKTCTPELRRRMNELVAIADVITPNITEVFMLLNEEYSDIPISSQKAKSYLVKLSEKGPSTVVITSVSLADNKQYNIGYDKNTNTFWKVPFKMIPVNYPGTGDIFASVMIGALLKGDSLPIAMNRATAFLEVAIKTTYSYKTDPRYGVMLESCLPWLIENQKLCEYEAL